jgi:hypothetical protein
MGSQVPPETPKNPKKAKNRKRGMGEKDAYQLEVVDVVL